MIVSDMRRCCGTVATFLLALMACSPTLEFGTPVEALMHTRTLTLSGSTTQTGSVTVSFSPSLTFTASVSNGTNRTRSKRVVVTPAPSTKAANATTAAPNFEPKLADEGIAVIIGIVVGFVALIAFCCIWRCCRKSQSRQYFGASRDPGLVESRPAEMREVDMPRFPPPQHADPPAQPEDAPPRNNQRFEPDPGLPARPADDFY